MLSRLLRQGSAAAQPMNWLEVTRAVPPDQQTIQYLVPTASSEPDASEQEATSAAAEAAIQLRIREAREAGRRDGELAGRQAAAAEIQPVLQNLGAAIAELAEFRPRLRREAEGDLVRLALAIARRVVNRELNVDPEAITSLVRAGMEKLRMQEILRVRVHPQHQPALRDYLARTGAGQVEISVSGVGDRGTVIVETSRGDLDLSVETQLAEIERGLTDRLRRSR